MGLSANGLPLGRPQRPIDWKLFEELCHIQCSSSEIASVLKINVDTLHDRTKENYGENYSVVYKRYAEGGKASLRRKQYKLATKNASMGIWLGKNWLDQKDSPLDLQVNSEIDTKYKEVMEQIKSLQSSKSDGGESNS